MSNTAESEDFSSIREQKKTEDLVLKTIAAYEKLFVEKNPPEPVPLLDTTEHLQYLDEFLMSEEIPEVFLALSSSMTWITYWIVHSLQLLQGNAFELNDFSRERLFQTLSSCRKPDGGFSGSPQISTSHLASTYAAVCAIATIGGEDFLGLCDKKDLCRFLLSLKNPTQGTFCMHIDGETDIRATYCALVVADLVIGLQNVPELTQGVAEAIARCQSYEGGFGPTPHVEAHGGYTYCAIAALHLLKVSPDSPSPKIDFHAALEWCVNRQLSAEGGFNGRPNKLVDGCYSFWVGASIFLLQEICGLRLRSLSSDGSPSIFAENECALEHKGSLLFDQNALQEFVLMACQALDGSGGFSDRPEDAQDLYHTCYCLSGLSIAQESGAFVVGCTRSGHEVAYKNHLKGSTCPVFNISRRSVERMRLHFDSLSLKQL